MDGILRFKFRKTGKAKYISHLDLMATMRRALLRAGVPLRYSDGFNPHPYISSALPLPIGCGSLCELMDIGVVGEVSHDESVQAVGTVLLTNTNKNQENHPTLSTQHSILEVVDRINATMPEGLEILEAYVPQRKFGSIAWVALIGMLYYDNQQPRDILDRLKERYVSGSIIVQKKTKRGESDIDLAQHIREVEILEANIDGNIVPEKYDIVIKAKVSAQNPTVNPETLLRALCGDYASLAPDFALFTRTEVFDETMAVFR